MIPDRIADEARALTAPWVHPFGIMPDEETEIVQSIAAALLAAEQRGREMEREEAVQTLTEASAIFNKHLGDHFPPTLIEFLIAAIRSRSNTTTTEERG